MNLCEFEMFLYLSRKQTEQNVPKPADEYLTIEERPSLVIQEPTPRPVVHQFPRGTYVENNFVVASDD